MPEMMHAMAKQQGSLLNRRQTVTGPGQKDNHEPWDRQDEQKQESSANLSQSFKALQVRRWEVREEPFQGFDSPPGRF
jgi:hypothetical protein